LLIPGLIGALGLLFLGSLARWLCKPRRLLDRGLLEAYTAPLTRKKTGRGYVFVAGDKNIETLYTDPKMVRALREGDTVLVLRERGKDRPLALLPLSILDRSGPG